MLCSKVSEILFLFTWNSCNFLFYIGIYRAVQQPGGCTPPFASGSWDRPQSPTTGPAEENGWMKCIEPLQQLYRHIFMWVKEGVGSMLSNFRVT